jgi:pseudouridine synthase
LSERIQKVLARAGVASRRAAEELVRTGRVTVNGQVVAVPGTLVDPDRDLLAVDGHPVAERGPRRYFLLNKPRGHVSTAHDERGRPTVVDLVPGEGRLYPVGRLDADSEGLLILTDDGDLAYALTHPRFAVPREYHVLVPGPLGAEDLDRLRKGVQLEEGWTAPAAVEILSQQPGRTWVCVVIRQGWKRQVRRMLATVGQPVQRLIRVGLGGLSLNSLPVGAVRRLSAAEAELARETNLAPSHHRPRRASGLR